MSVFPQRVVFFVLAGSGVKPLCSPDLIVNRFQDVTTLRAVERLLAHGTTLAWAVRDCDRGKSLGRNRRNRNVIARDRKTRKTAYR